MFPSHIHAWTQSDRYAIALGFLDNGFNILKPQTYNLSTTGGITGVDFPLNEYLVALLMRATGISAPVVFRLYTLCCSIVGCLFLCWLARGVSGSFPKGFVPAVFVFTCPVITYYQAGFIPSVASFSLALAAYCLYFSYKANHRERDFYLALALMTVAALTRTPFNIFLFAILVQQVWEGMSAGRFSRGHLAAFALAYGAVIAGNAYKWYLNSTYGTQFLTFLLPPDNFGHLLGITRLVAERWAFQLFSVYHYAILFVAVVSLLLHLARQGKLPDVERQILLQCLLVFAGSFVYFLLMAQQFVNHEYYFLDSFYLAFVLLLVVATVHVETGTLPQKLLWFPVFAALLVGAAVESKAVQDYKYSDQPWDRGEVTRKNFGGADIFLDSLGVPQNAVMLVLDAYSTNAPLILMGRKGHTVLHTSRESLMEAMELEFDFVVVQDVYFPSDVVYPYPEILGRLERVGGNGKISVFRPGPPAVQASLGEALGIGNPFGRFPAGSGGSTPHAKWSNIGQLGTALHNPASPLCLIGGETEFGPTFSTETNPEAYEKLLFEGFFLPGAKPSDLRIVLSVSDRKQTIHYREYPLRLHGDTGTWIKYQCLFVVPEDIPPGLELKCYVWNPQKSGFCMNGQAVTLYK